jgi:hypothetical protein
MPRIECTLAQLYQLWGEWLQSDRTLRFGQLVWNTYGKDGPWPELFYETDHNRAFTLSILCVWAGALGAMKDA